MKIHFVDGPLDGVTKHVESEPESTYYAPAIMASSKMVTMDDLSKDKAFMFNHQHRYMRYFNNPATGTVIYIYQGE